MKKPTLIFILVESSLAYTRESEKIHKVKKGIQ